MKPHVVAMLLGAGAAVLPALALAQASSAPIVICTNAQGAKEYTNIASANAKGCKKVDLPAITTIPAPKRAATAAPARAGEKAAASAPAGEFPKVDAAAQKARDSDRRQILQDELNSESQKLAALKKEYNNGEPERLGGEANYAKYQERVAQMKEDINRIQLNVDALRRELASLK